jgi:hypothetical protein
MPPSSLANVATPPTLDEWAGGSDAIAKLINAFYDRVEQDDLLSPFFPGGVHEDHRRHVARRWDEVFRGPARYTDGLGGYERMLSKHAERPRVPVRTRCLPGVGHSHCLQQLGARGEGHETRSGPEVGLGRSARISAVAEPAIWDRWA